MIDDGLYHLAVFVNASEEGAHDRGNEFVAGLQSAGSAVSNWFSTKKNQYQDNPLGQLQSDAGWLYDHSIGAYIDHSRSFGEYYREHPEEYNPSHLLPDLLVSHSRVLIENNYPGGMDQFRIDVSQSLADKNTYWNILGSPFSQSTKDAFQNRQYSEATGRAAGELSVEVAQETVENTAALATGGTVKGLIIVGGFAMDTRQIARTVDAVEDLADDPDYQRLKRHMEDLSTQIFGPGRLDHILKGHIGGNGHAGGFHHLPSAGPNSHIVPGTIRKAKGDDQPYEAMVVINGVRKKAPSTFFPDTWTRKDVIDSINEAHNKSIPTADPHILEGVTSTGIRIRIYLDRSNSGKIWSAHPVI